MIGYHFTGTVLRDGRPIPPIGEWLEHYGPITPSSGLQASEHPFDALTYAHGRFLHRVELDGDGEIVPHGYRVDLHFGRRRRILASIDATELLRDFARWCAVQVFALWNTPTIVQRYMETVASSLRNDDRDDVWAVAREAAAWHVMVAFNDPVAWRDVRENQRGRFAEMVDAAFAKGSGETKKFSANVLIVNRC
jgi:hypothetical protein